MRLLVRLLQEIRSPTWKLSRLLIDAGYHLFCSLGYCFPRKRRDFFFIFDASAHPVTFDIIYALWEFSCLFPSEASDGVTAVLYDAADLQRISNYSEYNKYVPDSDIRARIDKIIIPVLQAHGSISSIRRVSTHSELRCLYRGNMSRLSVFPRFYSPRSYTPCFVRYSKVFSFLMSLTNVIPAYSYLTFEDELNKPLSRPPYATLTLRDYGFASDRNTTQHEIDQVYAFCNQMRYTLIIIPDIVENLRFYTLPSDALVRESACDDLVDRASLYNRSQVNFFKPCGPSGVSLFQKNALTIILDWGSGSNADGSSSFYRRNYGLEYGDQPFLPFLGYLIWSTQPSKYNCTDLKSAHASLIAYKKRLVKNSDRLP